MNLQVNARFWIWINDGPVKLTLKPGQQLQYYSNRHREEGFSFESVKWNLEEYANQPWLPGVVFREWASGGRDCDGFTSCSGEDYCRIADLNAFAPEPRELPNHPVAKDFFRDHPICYPHWRETRPTEVYDEFAQAVNY